MPSFVVTSTCWHPIRRPSRESRSRLRHAPPAFRIGTASVGLVHGDGAGGTTAARARSAFEGVGVAAVLFGHSHIPHLERLPDGVWLFNPGSPTDKRHQPRYSFGILDVSGPVVTPAIHFYEDRAPG